MKQSEALAKPFQNNPSDFWETEEILLTAGEELLTLININDVSYV